MELSYTIGYGVCVINFCSFQRIFFKFIYMYMYVLGSYCRYVCGLLIQMKLVLTELQPFKFSLLVCRFLALQNIEFV